jgi:hypothetical protein
MPNQPTTSLSTSTVSKYDATTPPVASQLPKEVVGKLAVDLAKEIQDGKEVSGDGGTEGRVVEVGV